MYGLIAAKPGIAGISPAFIDRITFKTPAMPAAPSAWPMCALAEPTRQPPGSADAPLNASLSALISTGSPRRVPVPWASM